MSYEQTTYVFEFKGTVYAYSGFDAAKDAKSLREAMKGLGTDEKVIIDIVGARTNKERQEIEKVYKTNYGRDLKDDLKSELSGDFEDTVIALFYSPIEYDARCLHKAMCGVGTDEEALIEILATRSNEDIKKIKAAYKEKYGKELEAAIKDDTSGHFRRLLVILLTASREEYISIDKDKAQKDAAALYEAGEKCWGTDESKFNEILCNRSFPQLRATFYEYKKHTGNDIIKVIEGELSGDMEMGLKAIVSISNYAPGYFAQRLFRSMKGAGTDDSTLIRIVVSRCEVDMHDIKKEFEMQYGKSLQKYIKDDTSGDYKKMLLLMVEE